MGFNATEMAVSILSAIEYGRGKWLNTHSLKSVNMKDKQISDLTTTSGLKYKANQISQHKSDSHNA